MGSLRANERVAQDRQDAVGRPETTYCLEVPWVWSSCSLGTLRLINAVVKAPLTLRSHDFNCALRSLPFQKNHVCPCQTYYRLLSLTLAKGESVLLAKCFGCFPAGLRFAAVLTRISLQAWLPKAKGDIGRTGRHVPA